jgi:hypothetical protein
MRRTFAMGVNVRRFEIGADGARVLHAGDQRTIAARRL